MRMRLKAKCHPHKFEVFSKKVAHEWELGLCEDCHAAAKRTRAAEQHLVRMRMERARKKDKHVPRSAARVVVTAGIRYNEWVAILQLMAGACFFCRKASRSLGINYVIPLKRGGKDHIDNAVPACPRCIHRRGRKLVTEWPPARELLTPAAFEIVERYTHTNLPKFNLTRELNSGKVDEHGNGDPKERETPASART